MPVEQQSSSDPMQRLVAAMGLHERTNQVYMAMVGNPELGVADLAEALGITPAQLRADLDRMAELSLIRPTTSPDFYLAIPPDQAVEVLIARAEERIAREQEDIRRTREALPELVDTFVQQRVTSGSRDEVEYLELGSAVRARLFQLCAEAERSAWFMMPGPALSPVNTEVGLRNDVDMLARGVRLRTITSSEALSASHWRDYMRHTIRLGAAVRVLDAPPSIQVVIDEHFAVIPRSDSHGACVLRGGDLCAPARMLFEECWARATPLEEFEGDDALPFDAKHRQVLSLLAQGLTDEGMARRLGCSTRTVGRLISDITRELHATSRFQAGAIAQQRGLLDAR